VQIADDYSIHYRDTDHALEVDRDVRNVCGRAHYFNGRLHYGPKLVLLVGTNVALYFTDESNGDEGNMRSAAGFLMNQRCTYKQEVSQGGLQSDSPTRLKTIKL
jgi:hypothetical protein